MVYYLDYWIVVVIREWVVVTGQIFWNENLLALFKFENEHLFHEAYFSQDTLNVEDIDEATDRYHKFDLCQLFLDNFADYLVVKFSLSRPLIIHIHAINFYICEDLHAFCFVE